ncbi:hypothetical protein NKH77_27505 [Streptomyces sp. M19]
MAAVGQARAGRLGGAGPGRRAGHRPGDLLPGAVTGARARRARAVRGAARVRRLRFTNALDLEDRGLYWRLEYEDAPGGPGGSTCGGCRTTTRGRAPPTWSGR